MKPEIGSEYEWRENRSDVGRCISALFPEGSDLCLTLSGRTAIETVIRDLGAVGKVLMPSYCCGSMIKPFADVGAEIVFYSVGFDGDLTVQMDITEDCDVVFWCNYFGFHSQYPQEILSAFRENGGIVIEDITHSLLSLQQHHEVDYLVASVRKWDAVICGGVCCKLQGCFAVRPETKPADRFLAVRSEAMHLKKQYLHTGELSLKSTYMALYSEGNNWLASNYTDVGIDDVSKQMLRNWDIDQIRRKRRENAGAVLEALGQVKYLQPIFTLDKMDCPLFIPVVIDGGMRGSVRTRLNENHIFCPIHWPRPALECDSILYETELSLICDQRYSLQDMQRMIDVLKG